MKLALSLCILLAAGCSKLEPSDGKNEATATTDSAGAQNPIGPGPSNEVPPPAAATTNTLPPPPAEPAPAPLELATVKAVETQSEEGDLLSRRIAGPRAFYLAPAALRDVYTRVFPADAPRGKKTTGYFATNPKELFTPAQKVVLGEYNVTRGAAALYRADWITENSQVYQKNIREFLGEACMNLVTIETQRLATGTAVEKSTNVLVKRTGAPTADEISAFMHKLFGYAPAGGLHAGAAEYQAVFASSLAEKAAIAPDKTDAVYLQELHRLLCIAVGDDPRVYLR